MVDGGFLKSDPGFLYVVQCYLGSISFRFRDVSTFL